MPDLAPEEIIEALALAHENTAAQLPWVVERFQRTEDKLARALLALEAENTALRQAIEDAK